MLNMSGFKHISIWLTCLIGLILALPNGFYSDVERYNDAQLALKSGAETSEYDHDLGLWPSVLPSSLVNLGLDLRGGAHLLAQVQVEDVYETVMNAYWPRVRDALVAERDTVGFVTRENGPVNTLTVRISNESGVERALQLVRELAEPVVSLQGGAATDIVVSAEGPLLTLRLSDAQKAAVDDRTMRQSVEIVRRRIDEVGTREPTIQRQGTDRILIQVPGIGSAQEVKDIIGTTAQLTFHPVVSRTSDPKASAGRGNIVVPDLETPDLYYILERAPVVSGEDLVDAQPTFNQNNRPAVSFRFNASGARAFGDYTAENIGAPFAIVLDNGVISAPTIESHIAGGSGIITGTFSVEESINLAVLLRAGALPAELSFLEERTVGPELGQDSIDAGRIACIIAGLAVLLYMFFSYGRFGLFANIALTINVGLIFGLLSLIGATLTLPGIAGIVLTIGMAVDANVIVFERIREELKTAKGPARAIELGYERAMSSIIDANITTFMTALILFMMGSGPVRGFAITLGLGIITSVFTALFVTRSLVAIWYSKKRPAKIMDGPRLKLIKDETSFNFFGRVKMWLAVSSLAGVVSLGALGLQGLNFGIDFQGGTSLRTQSTQPVDIAQYRATLSPLDLGDVSISEVFDPSFEDNQHVTLIKIQAQNGEESVSNDTIQNVQAALRTLDVDMRFPSVESVGPKVSGELIQSAVISIVLAVIGIMIYIWLRFEWQFALGAVLALGHDVLITIGIFALLGLRFDLSIIAALLTIVGYSINDTVIVFDRVRENLRKYRSQPLSDVLNMSMNEMLSRTLMTSGTTMLALIALFVLGGDVIRGFVFAMMWGVFIGTYSSIFIATAVLLVLGVKRDWSKKAAVVGNQYANIDA